MKAFITLEAEYENIEKDVKNVRDSLGMETSEEFLKTMLQCMWKLEVDCWNQKQKGTKYKIAGVEIDMEKETLDKANCIQERIDNLEKMHSLFSGRNAIHMKGFSDEACFPGISNKGYVDYEALRETIEHLIYAEIAKARKELDAL